MGTGRPAGISIGRYLRFDRSAIVNEHFAAAVSAIDRVHGVGEELPEVPLINLGTSSEGGRRHADAWLSFDTGRDGEILPRSIAVRIGVPYRRIRALHEIGHYVDGCALPGQGFSSIEATELHEWRLAVIESRLYVELAELEASLTGRDRNRLAEAQRFDEL